MPAYPPLGNLFIRSFHSRDDGRVCEPEGAYARDPDVCVRMRVRVRAAGGCVRVGEGWVTRASVHVVGERDTLRRRGSYRDTRHTGPVYECVITKRLPNIQDFTKVGIVPKTSGVVSSLGVGSPTRDPVWVRKQLLMFPYSLRFCGAPADFVCLG